MTVSGLTPIGLTVPTPVVLFSFEMFIASNGKVLLLQVFPAGMIASIFFYSRRAGMTKGPKVPYLLCRFSATLLYFALRRRPPTRGREVKLWLVHPAVVGLRDGAPFRSKCPTPGLVLWLCALPVIRPVALRNLKHCLQRATSQHLSIIQATDPLICTVEYMYT